MWSIVVRQTALGSVGILQMLLTKVGSSVCQAGWLFVLARWLFVQASVIKMGAVQDLLP